MSTNTLIAIILFIIVLAGVFAPLYNATYGRVGSFVAAIAALVLFLMAVGVVHV